MCGGEAALPGRLTAAEFNLLEVLATTRFAGDHADWIDGVHCKDGVWPNEEQKAQNKLGKETPLGEGDVDAVFTRAERIVEATYSTPYLPRARMEPGNATVLVTDNRVDIWIGDQSPQAGEQLVGVEAGVGEAVVGHDLAPGLTAREGGGAGDEGPAPLALHADLDGVGLAGQDRVGEEPVQNGAAAGAERLREVGDGALVETRLEDDDQFVVAHEYHSPPVGSAATDDPWQEGVQNTKLRVPAVRAPSQVAGSDYSEGAEDSSAASDD